MVIDPGPNIPKHIDMLLSATEGNISYLVATHTHPDHSEAVKPLAKLTGAKVIGKSPPNDQDHDQTFKPNREINDGDIINIEDIPEANFSPVGDLCENDVVNLIGESNIIPVSCDFTLPGETPTYVWSVSPDSGYSLLNDSEDNPTTLEIQNPIITFTEEGSYTLSLTVTTECGSDTHSETFNVLANPNVDFDLDSSTFCSTSSTRAACSAAGTATPTTRLRGTSVGSPGCALSASSSWSTSRPSSFAGLLSSPGALRRRVHLRTGRRRSRGAVPPQPPPFPLLERPPPRPRHVR